MNINDGIKEIILKIKKNKNYYLSEKNKLKFGNYFIKK